MTRNESHNQTLREKVSTFLSESLTSEEMSYLDENSVALGISRLQLMENAGRSVAEYVAGPLGTPGEKILVVAGLGNNGGDGFVASRHLANLHFSVNVILLGRSMNLSEEAEFNWRILEKLDVGISLKEIHDSAELGLFKRRLDESDMVIDAMLGTGVKGNLREPIASAVRLLNSSGKQLVAVDTPTGLNPSTGEIHGIAVKASTTVTFHKMKKGFAQNQEYTGRVIVRDIGIPLEAELYSGPGDVSRVIKPREPFSHKGDYGYVLVVGGNEIYSGAPALAAMAALRTGAGLAIIAAPKAVSTAIRAQSPNLIVNPLPGEFIGPGHSDIISNLLQRVDSLIIGPGIGLRPETGEAVVEIIRLAREMNLPILADADALKHLKEELGKADNSKLVLTPHAGEFKILSGVQITDEWPQRIDPSCQFAREHGCVLLLKGHHTVVTDGRRLKINKTGNPAMATGGTGDVLSGIIGAYMAQGHDPFYSAVAGAYVSGRAGDLAYEEKGYHVVASDLIEKIPEVLKYYDL